ncbi:MAG: YggT family protein [Anaerolineales bacterium]|nr:MAG: YggT family protein [Anaerolineales bacterium]
MIWLYKFIDILFTLLELAILARVLLSWFRVDPYHPAVAFLYQITEPILRPLRNVIPPLGMMDISPIVAMLLLGIIRRIIQAIILGGL